MFTVKHFRHDGPRDISACERFQHDPVNEPLVLKMFGPNEEVDLHPDDVVFVENAQGKTVYSIRKREPAP